ncbi:MAG TPA: hypothetical protein VFH31_00925, partial [Pyrinomonadaceae bacterium]|nr:hypothetical protein [Pyrinomonadaceae bacterium]
MLNTAHLQALRILGVLFVSAVSPFRPIHRRAAENAQGAQRRIAKLNQYPVLLSNQSTGAFYASAREVRQRSTATAITMMAPIMISC